MVTRHRRSFTLVALGLAPLGCGLLAGLEDKELLEAQPEGGAGDGSSQQEGGDAAPPPPPDVVLAGLARPRGIAVDVGAIYFTEERPGFVKRLRKGEATPVVMARKQATPVEIVFDAAYVYWRNENRERLGADGGGVFFDSLLRLEKTKDDSTPPSVLVFEGADKVSEVAGLALYEPTGKTENLLFYTRQDRVLRKPRGSQGQEQTIQDNQNRPTVVTADDEWVYWVTEEDYSIRRQKKVPMGVDGGPPPPPERLHAGADRVFALALAVDEANVFWLDQRGRVFRRGKDPTVSPGETEIASSDATATGALALDRDTVFWVNGDRGTVHAVAKSGAGEKRLLAAAQDAPRGLAVDGFDNPRRVYWTTATSIVRVSFP